MKQIYLTVSLLIAIAYSSFSQTTLTEDANGVINTNHVVAQTSNGQIFFTGHQLGTAYSSPSAIFRAWTDNPTGYLNYFYEGITGGIQNFSVRADGQGYFASNVGIGIRAPMANLDVFGTTVLGGGNLDPAGGLGNISYLSNTGQMLIGWNRSAGAGETDFISNQGPGSSGGFAYYNYSNSGTQSLLMYLRGNGQLTVGDCNPYSYLLAVGGSMIATSVTVKTVSNWPDYVLKDQYSLPPLNEIKNYIDQNHHLPEIPSAQEIDKNGLDLGKMNRLLVKKVEELTLYMIEKDKEIKEQQMINKQSSEQMKLQQREIDELKTIIKSKIPNDKKSY